MVRDIHEIELRLDTGEHAQNVIASASLTVRPAFQCERLQDSMVPWCAVAYIT